MRAADQLIPNFAQVDPGIWRGGQPTTPDAWKDLRALGVSTVIKLNGDDQPDYPLPPCRIVVAPIDLLEQFVSEPPAATLMALVHQISYGTFIHCSHGQDRTGLVVGLYRVFTCGWAADEAWREMRKYGFHLTEFGLLKAWHDLTAEEVHLRD